MVGYTKYIGKERAVNDDFSLACSTLLLRKQLLTDTAVKHFSTNDSLLHQLISLMNAEIRVNKFLDTVHNVIEILCQCCVSAECRAAIVKVGFATWKFCPIFYL